jgi:hypothetical protein
MHTNKERVSLPTEMRRAGLIHGGMDGWMVGWMNVKNGPNKSYRVLVMGKCIIEFKIKGRKKTSSAFIVFIPQKQQGGRCCCTNDRDQSLVHRWMDGWLNESMDKWMDVEWIDGCMYEWIWMNLWIRGWMIGAWMNGWILHRFWWCRLVSRPPLGSSSRSNAENAYGCYGCRPDRPHPNATSSTGGPGAGFGVGGWWFVFFGNRRFKTKVLA